MAELSGPLGERDPVVRRRALMAIGAFTGDTARDQADLVQLLGDDDAGVRRSAVDLVARSGARPGVLQALDAAIRADELARRSSAVEALGKLGEGAVGTLAALLGESNVGLRRLAVDALGFTQATSALPALVRALADESPAVRAAALEALCRVDRDQAALHIRTHLRKTGETASVRLAALLALESLEARMDVDELLPHVSDPLTAVPAYRLLGRAGAAKPLVDAIVQQKGQRLRGALAGFAHAFRADSSAATRAVTMRSLPPTSIPEHLETADVAAVQGALLVGALLGRAEWFAQVAARPDRARLAAALHEAAPHLRERAPVERFRGLAEAAPDDDAATLLLELAQAAEQREARKRPAPPPRSQHPSLRPEDFRRLVTLFRDRAGLSFDATAAYRIESRLLSLLETSGAGDFAAYVDLLHQGSARGDHELSRAIERVTVHETYFFRELPQLDAFRHHVIPLLAEEALRRPVRVWSAGCSTGEEAWTLAILLEESHRFGEGGYEVVGSDIAPLVLETARAGRYGRRGFRGDVSGAIKARYFEAVPGPGGQEEHRLRDRIRARVRFELANLVEESEVRRLGRFDVIFCRNVLIYLTKTARERLIHTFYERLNPGGLLFLGHSESLLNLDTEFRFAPVDKELVYVRPATGKDRGRLGDSLLGAEERP